MKTKTNNILFTVVNLKKITFLVFSAILIVKVNAQSLSPSAIGSTGSSIQSGNIHLCFTVGETMVQTRSQSNQLLTEGFQQPTDQVNSILDVNRNDETTMIMYPIPANNQVWMGFRSSFSGNLKYRILNEEGKIIFESLLQNYVTGNKIEAIEIKHLTAGNYFCILYFDYNNQQEIFSKSFIITK